MKRLDGWVFLAASFGVFFFHTGTYWSGHWFSKWALLVSLFSIAIAFYTAKRTHWSFFPITAWALLSAARIGVWPEHPYAHVADPLSLLAIEKNALYAYIVVAMTALFIANYKHEWDKFTYGYLAAVGLITAGFMLYVKRYYGLVAGPYLGNASMAGCLVAALLPFAWASFVRVLPFKYVIPWIVATWIFAILAIYNTDSSAPIVAIGVSTIAYFVSVFRWRATPFVLVIAGVLAAMGHFTVKHQPFIHDSGRIYIWKLMGEWFKNHASWSTGMGLGTIQIVTPIVQVIDDPKVGNYFLWLHNDWLQMLLEMGYIGMACVLLAWGYLMLRAFKRPAQFAGICTFSAIALVNYPLRLPVHAYALVLICCLILQPMELDQEVGEVF